MRGLWRATNTTFIYNTLSATLEAWITGFVSAFLHIPDPFFVEVAHSPEPTTTLMLSLGASVLTGLILAPLDIIRTRMIVTKLEGSQRSLRDSIKRLKFMTCPLSLIIPTILNSLANNLFKKLTPYLLLVKFGIDSTTSPSLYGTISLISSILVLAVKLPIETLLRRAQVSYMLKRAHGSFNSLKITDDKAMVVKFAGYSGIFTTLWDILYFRGENGGVEAVFRGWRVGVLNVFGSWGLELLQNNYDDQISMEEKF
jgi:fusion and transport protein UGO1